LILGLVECPLARGQRDFEECLETKQKGQMEATKIMWRIDVA